MGESHNTETLKIRIPFIQTDMRRKYRVDQIVNIFLLRDMQKIPALLEYK